VLRHGRLLRTGLVDPGPHALDLAMIGDAHVDPAGITKRRERDRHAAHLLIRFACRAPTDMVDRMASLADGATKRSAP
jgi:hypothetical protein